MATSRPRITNVASLGRKGVSERELLIGMIHSAKDENASFKPVDARVASQITEGTASHAALPKIHFPMFAAPEDESDTMTLKKQLILLSTSAEDVLIDDALTVWVNLFSTMLPNITNRLIASLRSYNYEVNEGIDINEWKAESRSYHDIDLQDIDKYESATSSDVASIFGMHACFMGRLLTTQNAAAWIERRASAFANACGTSPDAIHYTEMLPDLSYASGVYRGVAPKNPIRKLTFSWIWKSSDVGDVKVLTQACKTALVYLYGAEMTPFMQINQYIVCQNPILLAWNELAKYADKLIAAYRKFESLGELGPYAKLIYPSDEVPEFNRNNLDLLSRVAIALAEHSGQVSMKNYRGAMKNEQVDDIIRQAIFIVDLYGGARTHSTEAVDAGLLIREDNIELREHLHKGGNIRLDLPNDPNPNDPLLFSR